MSDKTDQGELTKWVRQYTGELFAWALKKGADRQLAEDLVQDTFLAAAENLASFRGGSQPKTWLVGILKNKMADHYRSLLRGRLGQPLAGEDLVDHFKKNGHWSRNARPQSWREEPQQLMNVPAFNHIFDQCIDHLPDIMQACIRLKFLDEKKGEEICQELGISNTNYWQLVRRAKLQLRDCLEQNWFRKER